MKTHETLCPAKYVFVVKERVLRRYIGFVELKDNRAPPPPTDFCKNYLYEGIDLET